VAREKTGRGSKVIPKTISSPATPKAKEATKSIKQEEEVRSDPYHCEACSF